jgi:hypothetical protein
MCTASRRSRVRWARTRKDVEVSIGQLVSIGGASSKRAGNIIEAG